MDIKLTNGRKIIIKDKKYYEANIGFYQRNGFAPVDEIKKATSKDITDKVVQLKPKRKKNVKKVKKKV